MIILICFTAITYACAKKCHVSAILRYNLKYNRKIWSAVLKYFEYVSLVYTIQEKQAINSVI